MDTKKRFVVVVDLGSACSQADARLTPSVAESERDRLAAFFDSITGEDSVIVLSRQALDTDLKKYPKLESAFEEGFSRARGLRAKFIIAGDGFKNVGDSMLRALGSLNPMPATYRIEVTGAWHNPQNDKDGSVNAVVAICRRRGFEINTSNAVSTIVGPAPVSQMRMP